VFFKCFRHIFSVFQLFRTYVASVLFEYYKSRSGVAYVAMGPTCRWAPPCVTVMHLWCTSTAGCMDSCVREAKQVWPGLAYAQEAERARCGKRSDVNGPGNRAVRGGLLLCERIRVCGLGLGAASGCVLQLDVRALAAQIILISNSMVTLLLIYVMVSGVRTDLSVSKSLLIFCVPPSSGIILVLTNSPRQSYLARTGQPSSKII
jgi:hypothetical protein